MLSIVFVLENLKFVDDYFTKVLYANVLFKIDIDEYIKNYFILLSFVKIDLLQC